MALGLVLTFPRQEAVRLWAVSWVLLALGALEAFATSRLEGSFSGAAELTIRTFFVLGALATLAQGFLSWFQVTPDRGGGAGLRTVLWGGSVLTLVPVALGSTQTSYPAAVLVALWSFVPVLICLFLVVARGLSRDRGPVRAQSVGLLQALAWGALPFSVSWMVLPWFPGLGWSLGFPPFVVLGAVLQFRALVHYDTRFHHHHASPFLVQKTQDLVVFLQADGRVQAVNPAVRTLLDLDDGILVGRPLASLAADDQARRLLGPLEALAFPTWEGNLSLAHRNGRPVPVHLVFRRVHNPAREAVGAVLLLSDLRATRPVDEADRDDLLTTLANRRWVLELLEAEFQRSKRYGNPLTVLWLEISGLEAVEKASGTAGVDEVLRRVGAVLRAGLRKTDFCGRVGGREFLAVLPETPLDRAAVVSNRIEKMFALASEGEAPGAVLRVGVAALDAGSESTDDFVAQARLAVPPG
jgi:diguanylate cyclase (GGDEF)-like protein